MSRTCALTFDHVLHCPTARKRAHALSSCVDQRTLHTRQARYKRNAHVQLSRPLCADHRGRSNDMRASRGHTGLDTRKDTAAIMHEQLRTARQAWPADECAAAEPTLVPDCATVCLLLMPVRPRPSHTWKEASFHGAAANAARLARRLQQRQLTTAVFRRPTTQTNTRLATPRCLARPLSRCRPAWLHKAQRTANSLAFVAEHPRPGVRERRRAARSVRPSGLSKKM